MSRPHQWPVRVKTGNSTVSIYRIQRKKKGRPYQEFKLAYYNEVGKRLFQSFIYFRARPPGRRQRQCRLHERRGKVSRAHQRGQGDLLACPQGAGTGRNAFGSGRSPICEAAKLLGGASLLEAARYYTGRHSAKLPRKSVQEVIQEFLESRRQARRDGNYINNLKYHLGRFSEAFHTCIADLTRSDVLRFLNGLGLSPRSQYNFAKSLRTFFSFAREHGYLSKDNDELQGITAGDADPGEIEIYTPAEMIALLSWPRPRWCPSWPWAALPGCAVANWSG